MYSLSPREQTTRREHVGDLVRITGQQEESILRQMEDKRAGVGEGQDGRDTKPSSLTGRECTISQGAKLGSPAKARRRQAEWGCMWVSCGIPRLKMRQWRTTYLLWQHEDEWGWWIMVILQIYQQMDNWVNVKLLNQVNIFILLQLGLFLCIIV